jgi:phage/plasmid-associated DNA primase
MGDYTTPDAPASNPASAPKSRYNGRDPETLKTAEKLMDRGIDWLAYEPRSKNPNTLGNGWQKLPCPTLAEAERIFRDGQQHTIGAHLRRNLLDSDFDRIQVARAARVYFPPTGMMWGRPAKPRSHYFYWLPEGARIPTSKHKYLDPSPPKPPPGQKPQATLLELRQKGQTVAPGSQHEATGELIEFEPDGDGEPWEAAVEQLVYAADHTAAAGLVACHWNDGARHDMSLPLAGTLWHGGMSLADAEQFYTAVCLAAEDDELENRLGCLRNTYARGAAGENVTGGPTLIEEGYLTEPQVRSLRKWLKLKAAAATSTGILGPDLLPLAGDGDGERFAAMWMGQVLYCAVQEQWYLWDGQCWAPDRVGEIRERAKQVVVEFRRVLGERSTLCGQNGIASYAECADYSRDMGGMGAISAMLRSAGSKPELRVAPEEFDTHPLMLNTLDGTLGFDIDTGHVALHLHDPADKLTRLAPVHYRPNATHPLFTQYQRRFFPEAERRRFLQEFWGYTLHGLPKRHGLLLVGPHDAGKSVTLSLAGNMLGDGEYSGTLKYGSLMKNPHGSGGDAPRNDLWRVRTSRLVTVSEVAADANWDVALLKAFLGVDKFPVRDLHAGGEDIQWGLTLWMSGNKDYGPPPDEDAAYDRLEVLDCTHVVPEGTRDAREEWDTTHDQGVLDAAFAWAVRGFTRLYGEKHGALRAPPSSQKRKTQLRRKLDEWTDTLDTMFEFTGEKEDGVLKSEAWEWARHLREIQKNSYKIQASFESSLEARGARLTHSRRFVGRDYWEGVKWTEHMVKTYRAGGDAGA